MKQSVAVLQCDKDLSRISLKMKCLCYILIQFPSVVCVCVCPLLVVLSLNCSEPCTDNAYFFFFPSYTVIFVTINHIHGAHWDVRSSQPPLCLACNSDVMNKAQVVACNTL